MKKQKKIETMWCAIPPDKSGVFHVTYWRTGTLQSLIRAGTQSWTELYRGGWRIVRCYVQLSKPTTKDGESE